jgi:hypothetical protein
MAGVILLGGNQMADNFKTCGEAWRYCEKYGLNNISAGYSFQIAEALLHTYKDGAIQQAVEADAQKPCRCCSLNAGDNFCANCGRDLREI